jgi:hypothetical protein
MIKKRHRDGKKEEQQPAKTLDRVIRASAPVNQDREFVVADSLTRTKALLLAALRVWELKHPFVDKNGLVNGVGDRTSQSL